MINSALKSRKQNEKNNYKLYPPVITINVIFSMSGKEGKLAYPATFLF